MIVEPIARHLALDFMSMPGEVGSIYDHKRVGLVPGWDRSSYEDLIVGNRNGIDFEFFEAHLEEKRTTTDSKGRTRTTWVTVFRGQCIRFDFHKRFFGHTLVTRDAGFFNFFGKLTMGDLDRARLESPEFEKAFEVYTSDQVEARFLLTPENAAAHRTEEIHSTARNCAARLKAARCSLPLKARICLNPAACLPRSIILSARAILLNDFSVLYST